MQTSMVPSVTTSGDYWMPWLPVESSDTLTLVNSFPNTTKLGSTLRSRNFQNEILSTDAEAYGRAYFGEGDGDIFIENVQCNGSESSIIDCPTSQFGVPDCSHSEDAGVRCEG